MKKAFIHNPIFRLVVPPVFGVLVYLIILMINNNVGQISKIFTGQEVYTCIGLSYLLSESQRLLIVLLKKFNLHAASFYEITVQTLAGLGLALVLVSFAISSYFKYVLMFEIAEGQLIIFNCIYGVTALLYHLLYFSSIFMYRQNEERINNEKELTELLEKEMAQFKNEINPKLLYDALETLITRIYEDAETAELYIDRLSAVYRYLLTNRQTELTELKKEIKTAEHIIYLLNDKHFNNIYFTSSIGGDEPIRLIPGTLPFLVESIIRNTIVTPKNPLKIHLDKTDDYLILECVLNEKLTNDNRMNAIFESIQQSYTYFSEMPLINVKAEKMNYIKIPLLKVEEEVAV